MPVGEVTLPPAAKILLAISRKQASNNTLLNILNNFIMAPSLKY
jgi:hypothetical protein